MKAGQDRNTPVRSYRSSWGRRGPARGMRPGRKGVLQSAGGRRSSGGGPDLRPKLSFLAIGRGLVNTADRDSPPQGRLERVELGVPSLFECSVENRRATLGPVVCGCGCGSDGVLAGKSAAPCRTPTPDSALLGAVGPAAHRTPAFRPRGQTPEPGACRDAGTLCPRAPHRGLPLSRRWLRAGQPFFQHKGLEVRCFLWRKALARSE